MVVATQRSPEGEPVALTVVQAAADRVFSGEIVRRSGLSVIPQRVCWGGGGALEDPMSGRRFHVVGTRRGSATYREFNEVLEIIVQADEPLAAPARGA